MAGIVALKTSGVKQKTYNLLWYGCQRLCVAASHLRDRRENQENTVGTAQPERLDRSMLRHLRSPKILLIAILACSSGTARAQGEAKTLREVLSGENVPQNARELRNLDKRITSGATLNDAAQFVIAYFVDTEESELDATLFVDRFDRKKGEWQEAALGAARGTEPQLDAECTGSVLRIKALGEHFFLETHLNPSAGCVLIFSKDLRLQATLFGWVVGQMNDDQLTYERSEAHFAAVHPTELALYGLREKHELAIFPRKPYQALRQARIAQLREFYKTHEKWCRENDDPCDAEQFDSSLEGEVATEDRDKALAFVISYEQIQVFQGDQKPSGPEEVVYVYRHADDESKLEYREMLMSQVKAEFGNVALNDLLEPERLTKIFHQEPGKP